MIRLVIYLLIIATVGYLIFRGRKAGGGIFSKAPHDQERCPKPISSKIWKQVYETASMDEAQRVQARLEEEGIDCILYEQGKKDIHGNLLQGVGIAVPRALAQRAQGSIARMPV